MARKLTLNLQLDRSLFFSTPSCRNPMLMEVYGAYGFNLSASFDADWMPLLRRGWVLAFAHVR